MTANELLIALWKELAMEGAGDRPLRAEFTISLCAGPRLLLCSWNGYFFELLVQPVLPIDPDVLRIADSIKAIDAGDVE
jgi:hypothetical protein